jgi:hypothetical protein
MTSSPAASPGHLAEAIAFALRFEGRKRVHESDKFMAKIAAARIVRRLLGRAPFRGDEAPLPSPDAAK